MAYLQRNLNVGLGDSDLGAIRLSGGAARVAPPRPIPVNRTGAGGAFVVGGVPKMKAVRKAMKHPAPPAASPTVSQYGFDVSRFLKTDQTVAAERGRMRPGNRHPQVPLAPAAPLVNIINDAAPIIPFDSNGVGDYGVSTRRLAHSRVLYGSGGSAPLVYSLGDDDGLGGFSLKGIVKGVSKAVKTVASPVQKAAAAVGHTAGSVVTSKVGQAVLGTALAATGVGIPAAAAIMGGTKAVGNLIKPGGNLKHAATGLAQGAAEGLVAGAAGQAFKAVAPNAQASVSNVVKNIESKFVDAGKAVGKGVGKGAKGVLHAGETVAGGVVHGAEAVVKGVVGGAVGLGKKIIGIPGSFTPTASDPNGDGIDETTGHPSNEADSAERAGRATRGARIPPEQRPRVGYPGQFPRSPRDPNGTGIDQTTGQMTPEAAGGVQRGAATTPDQLPPDAPPPPVYNPPPQGPFGGTGGAGGPVGGGGFDPGSLAAGAAAAAGAGAGIDEANIAGAGAGLGGLLGNINPTMMLAGAAAFVFLPKLMGGGSSTSRRSGGGTKRRARSRSRRR